MRAAVTALLLHVEIGLGLLPIGSVELLDRKLDRRIETIGVHAPRLGMRTRLIEALHPAITAEQMLGRTSPEAIADKRIAARQQVEAFMRHDDVQETGHAAH